MLGEHLLCDNVVCPCLRRYLKVNVQKRRVILIVLLCSYPVAYTELGHAYDLGYGVFGYARKAGYIYDRGYAVNIGKAGNASRFINLRASVNIADAIAHKCAAVQNAYYYLVLCAGADLVHKAGQRRIRRV